MFHIFSKSPPILPDISDLPPNTNILVFDPTPSGYRQVIAWIDKHPDTDYARVILPLNALDIDVGDAITRQHYEFKYDKNPMWTPVKVIFVSGPETRSAEQWPFLTLHRRLDFVLALQVLEDDVLLPDAYSGLSRAQQHLLLHKELGEDATIALTVQRFEFPLAKIRPQWHALSRGNRPVLLYPDEHQPVPRLLTNGMYPVHVKVIVEKIRAYMQTGKMPCWEGVVSSHAISHNHSVSRCEYDVQGNIIAPPYSVHRDVFHLMNVKHCTSLSTHSFRYAPSATEHLEVKLQWNGQCRAGQMFMTIQAYMDWWILQAHDHMVEYLIQMEEEAKTDIYRREFLLSFYVNKKFELNDGTHRRCFIDESEGQKRARIDYTYGGHHEFLHTEIGDICSDVIYTKTVNIPESARDIWATLLDELE